MSVCPGCGRCRECGQPAPVLIPSPPTYGRPYAIPTYTYTICTYTIPSPYVYVGDVIPGSPGSITVTNTTV